MKKLYIAPDAEMLRFAPVEQIAKDSSDVEFSLSGGYQEGISDPNAVILNMDDILSFKK